LKNRPEAELDKSDHPFIATTLVRWAILTWIEKEEGRKGAGEEERLHPED